MTRRDMERDIGFKDGDSSKPLLLKLIEQVKYGGPMEEPITAKKASPMQENSSKFANNFE